jgi:ribosome-associated toxin RatA of RatAB toxin-antitoxin module
MHLENTIVIDASVDIVFRLAAEVERWPDTLPHYRRVRVLERRGNRKLVEMAAHRDGLPVSWTSIQELMPAERRILFRHVRGISRGMAVEWRLEPLDGRQTRVSIEHDFSPGWPLIGERAVQLIVGEFIVSNIAGKTLRQIKALAEAEQAAAAGRPAGWA